MIYIVYFLGALIIALLITPQIKRVAFKIGAVDVPHDPRKIHNVPTSLLGGFTVFISFFLMLWAYLVFAKPNFEIVPERFFVAMFIGGAILMVGGFLDDKYNLPPKYSFVFPLLASLTVVLAGIGVGITKISNPFGSPFDLSHKLIGLPVSGIFVWVFVMGMIYTTKFLDGMDGLAGGISFIATFTLFLLSLTPKINQPITAELSIIFGGALLGFLFYNFNPASIFLGEAGSTFLGFVLGTLSILLGGKIATAILVMGIPILDVAWVITRRIWYGASPFKADRKHLHFRLLDIGYSQKQTVLILYCIAAVFGFIAIFLQSLGKLISLLVLVLVMIGMAIFTVIAYKKKHNDLPNI